MSVQVRPPAGGNARNLCAAAKNTVARSLIIATAVAAGFWCASVNPALAGVFGSGTYVWIPTATESSSGGGSKFSNPLNGYTSTTDLLFGSIANGLTSDTISGNRSVDLSTLQPGLVCIGSGCLATASGNAAADLSAGTLRVFSTSAGTFVDQFGFTESALLTVSQAGFEDTLTAATNGTMHFDINVTGSLSGSASAGIQLYIYKNGSNVAGGTHAVIGTGGEVTDPAGCVSTGSCDISAAADPANFSLLDVPVTAGDAIDFVLVLEADAANGTSDFSHTLNLDVAGVAYTSDSGVFLSAAAPTNSVPEPATLVLLSLGLASLGFIRHRRPQ